MTRYKYSDDVVISEPWRYTESPIWKRGRERGWHKFIPAKIDWRGLEEVYYKGHHKTIEEKLAEETGEPIEKFNSEEYHYPDLDELESLPEEEW